MAILLHGKKVTANQAAKYLVWDQGAAAEVWEEDTMGGVDVHKTTEKEKAAIHECVQKHRQRLWDFLGLDKVTAGIWADDD